MITVLTTRRNELRTALDKMISAIAAAQGISKSQADVLAGDWKSKFMLAVEPLGSTSIYEDGRYVNIVDKLNNIANDRATAQRFLIRDNDGLLKVADEYQVNRLFPSLSHSLPHQGRIGLRQALISNVLGSTQGRSQEGGYFYRALA